MKKALRWMLPVIMAGSMSSCFLFKKKCDCPKFGAAGGGSVYMPEAVKTNGGKKSATQL